MQHSIEHKVDLILASASMRRRLLLSLFNIHYDIQAPNIDEAVIAQEAPLSYVRRIARQKANIVWQKDTKPLPVLAADTTVVLNGKIIGKPSNQEDARICLHSLSGREHQILTAICLRTNKKVFEASSISTVKFRQLSLMEIEAYCSTEEPLDKAGAYAIQGRAAAFIEYFYGSYTGVMGLPLYELGKLLARTEL